MENLALLVDSLAYIEEHLCDNLRTEDIAERCHCSRSTLEKLFQCVNHISVHGYVTRRRMMYAARRIAAHPQESILAVALEYGYQSNEAFTRAFKEVWNCNPSEFRGRKFWELYPRLQAPCHLQKGETYTKMYRKNVDISELYDLFAERKDCFFVCCDIKSLIPINEISRKAGDLAILESLHRMSEAAGEEDMVFRIGGDEFCVLTNSSEEAYAQKLAEQIRQHNGEIFLYEDKKIPLSLYVTVTKCRSKSVRYKELFSELHNALDDEKNL